MRHILFIILFLLIGNINAFATPSEQDRQKALELMYTLTTDQELHFEMYSSYESIKPQWHDGLVTYSCAYSTTNGKGYIVSVVKTENGMAWRIQRHFGPEIIDINGTWTCITCNNKSFKFPVPNEHGLCDIQNET